VEPKESFEDFDELDLDQIAFGDFSLVLSAGLDMGFDSVAQLTAIYTLIGQQRHSGAELRSEIKRVEGIAATLSGSANSHAVDTVVDLIHESIYQSIAHSP